jgi:hypothetical protein
VFGNLSLPYTTVFLGSETGVEVIRQRLLDGQPTFFYLWYVCLFRPEIRTINSHVTLNFQQSKGRAFLPEGTYSYG